MAELVIPHHMQMLRIVTLEDVSFVMASSNGTTHYEFYHSEDGISLYYRDAILQAVRMHEIRPFSASCKTAHGDNTNIWTTDLDPNAITLETQITHATFRAEIIWPWVKVELAKSYPWLEPETVPPPPEPEAWSGSFAGKDTALLLIAGFAKVLEGKSGGVYKWKGGKANKMKMAEEAAMAISAAFNHAEPDKIESFRKLIAEALATLPNDE